MNLPAWNGSGRQPFHLVFKLDTPFVYLKVRGDLLIEYVVTNSPVGHYVLDGQGRSRFYWQSTPQACAGRVDQLATFYEPASGPASMLFEAKHAAPIALHVLGTFLLQPPFLLPMGGCQLHTLPFHVRPVAPGNGNFRAYYIVPEDAARVGNTSVVAQWILLGNTSWDASSAMTVRLAGSPPQSTVMNLTSSNAASGNVISGFAPIHRLR